MDENKKQHFVPRFSLENFFPDRGIHTNLVRVAELKPIAGIPVADQCQRSYFYGRDLGLLPGHQVSQERRQLAGHLPVLVQVGMRVAAVQFEVADPKIVHLRIGCTPPANDGANVRLPLLPGLIGR